MLKNTEVREDKSLTKLEVASQKYYEYLVDRIVDGTEVTMQINSDREEFICFVLYASPSENLNKCYHKVS